MNSKTRSGVFGSHERQGIRMSGQACKPLLIACFLMLTGVFVAGSPHQTIAAQGSARNVYTPPPGSVERRAILDVMRMKVKAMHELDVVFIVKAMHVSKGWAWVQTFPRSKDGSNSYEHFSALLHKKQGRWTIAEIPCTEPENPNCIDSPGYFRRLARRFPGMPSSILPTDGAGH